MKGEACLERACGFDDTWNTQATHGQACEVWGLKLVHGPAKLPDDGE